MPLHGGRQSGFFAGFRIKQIIKVQPVVSIRGFILPDQNAAVAAYGDKIAGQSATIDRHLVMPGAEQGQGAGLNQGAGCVVEIYGMYRISIFFNMHLGIQIKPAVAGIHGIKPV